MPSEPRHSPVSPAACSYLLLVILLVKIVGLEVFLEGFAHRLVEGIGILGTGYVLRRLSGSPLRALAFVGLAGAALVLDAIAAAHPYPATESALWCAGQALVVATLGHSLIGRYARTRADIIDTVSLYLSSGIAFADLYCVILAFLPGAIAFAGQAPGAPLSYDVVIYFSFITQASVGYGDIVPAHRLSRLVSMFQTLYGVMFIAILLARVVADRTASRSVAHGGG